MSGSQQSNSEDAAGASWDDGRSRLDAISSFILTHELEVNSFTLATAYEIVFGNNETLATRVAQRVSAREPVTLDWLQTIADEAAEEENAPELQVLVEELESTMGAFARTASDARNATTQYSSALEQHARGLDQSGTDAKQITRVVKEVLSHTRTLEDELDRSEREVHRLERRLADARRDAEVDYLTGLPNRRAFEMIFERELNLACEKDEPLCVAFCDIDHFKQVNDVHGHEAGDRVLRYVAETLSSISGERCHVARHGGEEFGAIFRGLDVMEAWAAIDEVRDKLAGQRLVNRATDVPFGQITFSAGVAWVRAYSQPRTALRAADDALYQAKRTGRNRVVIAELPEH
ncbi:GGDEF domain-containing protein [Novosphingobium sp. M1R2S20]|uniref:diguanylate cyclase n=1 Tax=Novosphingobium rhizovicinum TaxID=3228928 RepID=A0ABV3R6P3_9SPHN